jgi:hypothetical protein
VGAVADRVRPSRGRLGKSALFGIRVQRTRMPIDGLNN